MIKVICEGCKVEFERVPYEYKRNKKLGRSQYCSRKCRNDYKLKSKSHIEHLRRIRVPYTKKTAKIYSGNRKDDYTGFRSLWARAKSRHREFDITLDDLVEQWNKQNGQCIYSNVKLTLPQWRKASNVEKFLLASLDRVDSSKGYVKENIQFVSVTCNYAKNGMTHKQMLEFCKLMRE